MVPAPGAPDWGPYFTRIACVFHFIEVLAAAGEAAGLEPAMAMRLARQILTGAAALAALDGVAPPASLRELG